MGVALTLLAYSIVFDSDKDTVLKSTKTEVFPQHSVHTGDSFIQILMFVAWIVNRSVSQSIENVFLLDLNLIDYGNC